MQTKPGTSIGHQPAFEEYRDLTNHGNVVPVFRTLISDTLTPVTAFLRIQEPSEPAFLFESVVGGEKVGRYSFVGSSPFLRFEARRGHFRIEPRDSIDSMPEAANPLEALQQLLDRFQTTQLPGLPRFCGGAVGYLGYDAVRYTENLPNPPHDDRELPDAAFGFYDRMVIFDHIQKTVAVIAHAHIPNDPTEEQISVAYQAACDQVDLLVARLATPLPEQTLIDMVPWEHTQRKLSSNQTQAEFEDAVEKCKEYIRAGDVFQVVISQRLETECAADPFDVYRTLRVVNPSPFMFYLRTADCTLVGSSPEIMVRVEDGEITLRPLAGTRKRGQNEQEDNSLAEELLGDPKERAEHIMLVDLGRNDVGRVAEYNSVNLSDVMTVERYSHVMHITSNVTGTLKKSDTALDALQACLPAGTVSGAPKVRAMEIIDELEPHRRGPYAGAVGYIDYTGNMDTCIALRTLVFQGSKVFLQAGAGIVYDSNPTAEYQETLNKARALIAAIEIAEKQFAANGA